MEFIFGKKTIMSTELNTRTPPQGTNQPWQSEPHTPSPIDGTTAKRTTPRM